MPEITSVWSAHGHRFIATDGSESCLTCGAVYELSADPDGPTHGRYHAANGDAPRECTGDTSMAHGYPGERGWRERRPRLQLLALRLLTCPGR
jgi:hypothetical protein